MLGALTIALAALSVAPPDGSFESSADAGAQGANGQPSDEDPAALEARRVFNRGTALYETQRFDEAIEAFTTAFELAAEIDDEALRRRTSSVMLFNLARVQLGAYSVDRDVEHLRQAENLLHKYRAAEQEMGHDPDSDVDLRRLERELAAALDDAQAESRTSGALTSGDDRRKPQPALFWSGVGSFALAGAGLGVMGAGLGLGAAAERDYVDEPSAAGRDDIDQRGRTANIIAIAGGASAGVFAAVGTGLLVAAYRKADGDQARVKSPRWWVRGQVHRGHGGVILGGRF